MKIRKIINYINSIAYYGDLTPGEKDALHECVALIEKYVWHNLIENPNDVPNNTRKVEVIVEILGVRYEEHGYYIPLKGKWKLQSIWTGKNDSFTYMEYELNDKMKVVAWKEIDECNG